MVLDTMDNENSVSDENNGSSNKTSSSSHMNGVSNGYSDNHKSHKSDHKDKHRDRDKDKNGSKSHKSSSRDKDRHSVSSKDKDRHSSSHKSSSRDKDRSRDHHKSSSSSSRDKDKERDKDRDRDHKSSRDKEHKSSSRDKDRDKDRHRHSSSKDKHKDKHREKDRDKHSSSRDKDRKDKEKSYAHPIKEEEEEIIKKEPEYEFNREDSVDDDDQKLVIKEENDYQMKEENDEDIYEKDPNISAASSCDYNLSQFKDEPKLEESVGDEESEEDIPLSARLESSKRKIESEEDDDDDVPLTSRKKVKKEKSKKRKNYNSDDDEEEKSYKVKKEKKVKREVKQETTSTKKKKKEEEEHVWKWWEEEKKDDGTKWKFLEHRGPMFAPPYEKLPSNIKFFYDGKEMRLSEEAEEVAGFYARMLDHDYTTKDIFNKNFFGDWRKCMTEKEQSKIVDLSKCNFKQMQAYFLELSEKNRNRTKEEKLALKEKNEEIVKEYGFCKIDGHKEKIGNFRIEPPGLFRGRGEHPKMGKLKKRVKPEHVSINCSQDSEIPKPPAGHRWKDVRHDPTVTWLASWTENVQGQVKYVMLNASSKLKGEKDWQKYETARKLHRCIDKIRTTYKDEWKSKEMRIRQRAVALYFIDKLALRAGNEKDEDQADTVGCCSLRVEHIQLHEEKDDKEYVVVFDFLGKDSIRYYNEVPVEKRVFKNLQLFMENKKGSDDLFDRLNTSVMNKHLNELMEGLTAKVFRTYNASFTLQQQLDELTNADDNEAEKILSYNRANRAVAVLCNHQRAVPKTHEKSMEKLKEKIDAKREAIREAERGMKEAKRDAKNSVKEKQIYEKKKLQVKRLNDQLGKLQIQETDRDENKTIALGTSKLNYLDPRISVAWCKKFNVAIEKIYNKTQRDKFRWAIDMAGPEFVF
ncbi:PREDICTED: DNA topoisomerase I, mitochondrial isoform X2 [Nicrophorus vespilloides]|uniref:DNA topoisomerase I n=1 Tax=Nicrophorus vespilloides TaxID=110193 RepID=A0ABM1MLJ6_NICVS|nr:PREDICTED: DNA topoisomerase I, mitochondrial isoform X2 [Nicrophorus vespilloides]